MNHKIVCWEDYAIPVPLWASWMAQDENGDWFVYLTEPSNYESVWIATGTHRRLTPRDRGIGIVPPEPGPWTDQLYWIGD